MSSEIIRRVDLRFLDRWLYRPNYGGSSFPCFTGNLLHDRREFGSKVLTAGKNTSNTAKRNRDRTPSRMSAPSLFNAPKSSMPICRLYLRASRHLLNLKKGGIPPFFQSVRPALSFYLAYRKYDPSKGLIQHFRHRQIYSRKPTHDTFPTCQHPYRCTACPIPYGEEPEQYRKA